MVNGSTIMAGLKYHDAPAAIEWLCGVFGFAKQAVYAEADGRIMHAQLTLGGGMVMLSSVRDSEYQKLTVHPGEGDGRVTTGLYVIVEDPDAAYARAKAAGARILVEIKDEFYGGRDFTCADPEGYVWSAGSYDPWKTA
jgi:uncharacterized glyoxalase superfamily protein PhnB